MGITGYREPLVFKKQKILNKKLFSVAQIDNNESFFEHMFSALM